MPSSVIKNYHTISFLHYEGGVMLLSFITMHNNTHTWGSHSYFSISYSLYLWRKDVSAICFQFCCLDSEWWQGNEWSGAAKAANDSSHSNQTIVHTITSMLYMWTQRFTHGDSQAVGVCLGGGGTQVHWCIFVCMNKKGLL